jgi:hypothetical protein
MVKHKGQGRAHPAVWGPRLSRAIRKPSRKKQLIQIRTPNVSVGTVKKSIAAMASRSFLRNVNYHFHGIRISRGSPDPSQDTPFRDVETQFDHFAVNARCCPGRILGNLTEDQGANLFAINM